MKPFALFHKPRFPGELLKLNNAIKQISLIFFIYGLGWGIVAPVFPVYISTLFGNYKSAGILAAALEFFALFFGLFLGPILDKLQKKSLMGVALFLYLPFTPILFALTSIVQLMIFRVYHAVIAASLWLTGEAYVREHSEKHKEAQSIGLFDFGTGAAQVIGGFIGAAIVTSLGFNVIYAVSIFGFLAFIASIYLPDKNNHASLTSSIKGFSFKSLKTSIKHFEKNKAASHFLYFLIPYYFVAAMIPLAIPLFVSSLGGSLSLACLASALYYVPMLFESFFSTTKRKHALLTLALCLGLTLFIVLSAVNNVVIIFALTIMLGICFAAISPILSGHVTELLDKKKIGEQTSVIFASKSLAACCGLLTAGFVADSVGLKYVFMIGSGVFMLLLVLRKGMKI